MHTVTSFHGSDVPPEQLKELIMTDYLALEHAPESFAACL